MVGFWTIGQHYPLLPGFSPWLGPYFSLEQHVSFPLSFSSQGFWLRAVSRVACRGATAELSVQVVMRSLRQPNQLFSDMQCQER